MKPTLFSKSFKILIIVLLLAAVLFNRSLSQQIMLAAIAVWVVLTVCLLSGTRIISLLSFGKTAYLRWRKKWKQTVIAPEPVFSGAAAIPDASEPALEQTVSEQPKQDQKRMLQHISLRITEKLKSAYPDATWQWDKKPCLSEILEGKTFRIATEDMDRYTHADVCFDQFARIRITPLIIGEFAASDGTATEPDTEETKEPPVVDVQSWYELIGKEVLETIITDLNANGHSRLSIKENGDIVITRNKKETLKGTLEQFPPKNYWSEFLKLLEEYELHGKAEKDRITVSWT